MKRILSAWILICLLSLPALADVWQDQETKVNYEYEPGSGVAIVKSGDYPNPGSPDVSPVVVIPSEIQVDGNEYKVTSIGEYAFANCLSLTSVAIGNGVIYIGDGAFANCSSLTSVTIGNGVIYIGNFAFYSCSSLTSITIPNNVTTIGGAVFEHCSSLTSITIPNSLTSIGDGAF